LVADPGRPIVTIRLGINANADWTRQVADATGDVHFGIGNFGLPGKPVRKPASSCREACPNRLT
jgi:hypothetical protein